MLGELTQFYMFPCSHEICLFYKMGKKWGNKKRVVYLRGGSSTCTFSWGLGTTWAALLWRTHLYRNLPYNAIHIPAPISKQYIPVEDSSKCETEWELYHSIQVSCKYGHRRPSPTVLSMWLQTIKFIVKKSKCASLAQEIGFFAPNVCSLPWLVKGATQLCTSRKECNKLDLTAAQYYAIAV